MGINGLKNQQTTGGKIWPRPGPGTEHRDISAGITIFWPGPGMGINPFLAPGIPGAGNPGRFL